MSALSAVQRFTLHDSELAATKPAVLGPRFWIRGSGVEPPGVRSAPTAQRKAFWTAVSGFVIEAKDAELKAGLDRDGNAMVELSEYTIKHRKSAMGPADPDAPPLTPAYGLSRTRSLFTAQAMSNATGVVCWWTYDRHTGDSWGEILKYHRDGTARLPVRNVFGLSNVSLARIKEQARLWWLGYQQGEPERSGGERSNKPGPIKFQSTGWGRATPAAGSGPSPLELRGGKIQVTLGNHVYTMQGGLGLKLPKQPPPAFASKVPKPRPTPARQIASMRPAKREPEPSLTPQPFDWSQVVNQTSRPYLLQTESLVPHRNEALEVLSTRSGFSQPQVAARLTRGLSKVIRDAELYTATDQESLEAILRDGRFKTLFETGRSHGLQDIATRSKIEERILGTPQQIDPTLRPIYGHLSMRNFGAFGTAREQGAADYGVDAYASIRLKPAIRDRTTLILGDSFNFPDSVQASRLLSPDIASIPVTELQKGHIRVLLHSGQIEGDILLDEIQRRMLYVETHYHGGLKVSDIRDILFVDEPQEELARLLRQAGIPWRVQPKRS